MLNTHSRPAGDAFLAFLSGGGWQTYNTRSTSFRSTVREQVTVYIIHYRKIFSRTQQCNITIHILPTSLFNKAGVIRFKAECSKFKVFFQSSIREMLIGECV